MGASLSSWFNGNSGTAGEPSETNALEQSSLSGVGSSFDDGAGVHPRSLAGDPPPKRQRLATTDLSDKHVYLCVQDAIMAVQNRVNGCARPSASSCVALLRAQAHCPAAGACTLPAVENMRLSEVCASRSRTQAQYGGPADGPPRFDAAADGRVGPSSLSSAQSRASGSVVLDSWTQRAFYDMLHGPLTALQHQTALRRHSACSRCALSDVLRVSDLGQRVFLMVPMRWRGPFARVCREWAEISHECWQADEYELVKVLQHMPLGNLGGSVMQLSSWVRASQTKPIFFLLALSEEGRLEQMRISCKKAEPGVRRPDADDAVRVEQSKDWRLEDAVPSERLLGVSAQFVVTKHHAYCVVAVRGQALLVKLGGQTNGTHEHMYTDRFPAKVTTMSMCPLDNNIIAFGVPLLPDAAALDAGRVGGASRASPPVHQVIELVNFAQSSRIQTCAAPSAAPLPPLACMPTAHPLRLTAPRPLTQAHASPAAPRYLRDISPQPGACIPRCTVPTRALRTPPRSRSLLTEHEQPMIFLDYSPDSEQLLSCSPDCIQLWYKEGLEDPIESRGPGAMDEKPERTLHQPNGTVIRIAKVHPAWTSVLVATNEALEVRELRRQESETPRLSAGGGRDESCADTPLGLKWRRQNMQVTAAAFISHGNMLVVSDRGDRLLLLNYHGLHAAKRCVLPWASPYSSAPPVQMEAASLSEGTAGLGSPLSDEGSAEHSGGGRSSHLHGVVVGGGGGGKQGVCTVTSIVECPDVARTEEWCSGVSQLAVSSSRGDIVLIKI